MDYWFWADLHLDHPRILQFTDRGYSCLEEMQESIISECNKYVRPTDTLVLLGDVAFKDARPFVSRMNGQKLLIRGNHDAKGKAKNSCYGGVFDTKLIKAWGHLVWCSHYAHRVWPQSHYGAYHVYGHSHGRLPDMGRSTDVGYDNGHTRPVSLSELIIAMEDIGRGDEDVLRQR